jgi:hypothetical protein
VQLGGAKLLSQSFQIQPLFTGCHEQVERSLSVPQEKVLGAHGGQLGTKALSLFASVDGRMFNPLIRDMLGVEKFQKLSLGMDHGNGYCITIVCNFRLTFSTHASGWQRTRHALGKATGVLYNPL